MYTAIARDFERLAVTLIAKGANLRRANKQGNLAMILACQERRVEVVRAMLAKDPTLANIVQPRNDVTPLFISMFNGHPDVVKILVAAGADPMKVDLERLPTTPHGLAAHQTATHSKVDKVKDKVDKLKDKTRAAALRSPRARNSNTGFNAPNTAGGGRRVISGLPPPSPKFKSKNTTAFPLSIAFITSSSAMIILMWALLFLLFGPAFCFV